jgi:hypothetical protein
VTPQERDKEALVDHMMAQAKHVGLDLDDWTWFDTKKLAGLVIEGANEIKFIGELFCNEHLDEEETAKYQAKADRLLTSIRYRLAPLKVRVGEMGDPRGCGAYVYFTYNERFVPANTWGGEESGWGLF